MGSLCRKAARRWTILVEENGSLTDHFILLNPKVVGYFNRLTPSLIRLNCLLFLKQVAHGMIFENGGAEQNK
jgi:hypothetical protein